MTVVAMCVAAIASFSIGIVAARHEIAGARGLEKLVPRFMPWRSFWVYFVGAALIAASLSIATKIAVRWSGLLAGLMMFSFVAMIHLPGALTRPNRIIWTVVFRELSFGGAAWILAGT